MDLKKLYDAVNAATARVREIAANIEALLDAGQNDEALAKKVELEQAQAAAARANDLYMTAAAATSAMQDGSARQFVPAGGAAATTLGMPAKDVKNYSLLRAILAAADAHKDPRAWERAGLELEASRAVAEKLGRQPQGFFVPYDVQMTPLATQQVGDPSTGGYLKMHELRSDAFIDVLRAKMILRQAGATVLTGLVGDIDIPKKTGASTGYWIGEGNAPSKSALTFGQIALRARTLAGYMQLTRKFLRQSSVDAEAMARDDMAATLAVSADLAGLHGAGAANEPLGLQYLSGIGSVVGGDNGLTPAWSHIVGLETEVATDNADIGSLAYITNPKVRGKLKQITKANNQNGFVWEGSEMNGYPAYATTQVKSNLTKGSSTDVCSAIFFGNWADLVYGYWGGLDVLVDPYTNSTSGDVLITAMLDLDVVFRRAQSFAAMLDALTA